MQLSRRHDVYLVSLYRDSDLALVSDISCALSDLQRYCKLVSLIYHPVGGWRAYLRALCSLGSSTPYSISMYKSHCLENTVLKILDRYPIDLIHVDTMGLVDRMLLHLKGSSKVLNHHNIESAMMDRRAAKTVGLVSSAFFKLEAAKLRKYERTIAQRYDLHIVVSDLDERRLKEEIPSIRTAIVENGVDCDYFQPIHGGRTNQELVFTGALDWYPNESGMWFFCTEIWPALKYQHIGLRLTIVGKNPALRLRQLASSDSNIELLGYVPDVRPVVGRARIFVCPIVDGGGTRLKILDAMAQGIPVVSTSIGCEGLGLTPGQHLLVADTPGAFIKSITALLVDDELCGRLAASGCEYVAQRFSFDNLGGKLSSLYEQLRFSTVGD